MKKQEVEVGKTYRVKVSGTLADVRITGENPHGGWDGVNVATKRSVRIKSAQRLRSVAGERPAKRTKIVSLAEYESGADQDAPTAAQAADVGAGCEQSAPTATEPTAKEKKPRAKRQGKTSGLDAAAQVLADAGEPMNCKTMVERMLAQGLWKTNGKTPQGTIYAAILREIGAKGEASRFRRTARGMFELTK